MKTRGLGFLASLAMSLAAHGALVHRLTLYVGQIRVLATGPVRRIAIGNGHLIGATALTRTVVLVANHPGATDCDLWTAHGFLAYHIRVTRSSLAVTQGIVHRLLHRYPTIHMTSRAGRVLLTGTTTPSEAKRLVALTHIYPSLQDFVRPTLVAMRPMVMLDVRIVNFAKTALDNLGINWQTGVAGPAVGVVSDWATNSLYRLGDVTQGGTAADTLNGPQGGLTGLPLSVPFSPYAGLVTALSSQINLAVQNGEAYILAHPRLVTRSGKTASFLAGGEVPIPVASGFGQTSVTYKSYGVKLAIKPVVDIHRHVLAAIQTAISQINPALTVNGYPAFLTRKTSAVVNVRSGQTIVLSGLVHATGANTVNKFPWLGDIPVLGALFRSTQFQRDQSALVIFVTPRIIRPQAPENRALIATARTIKRHFTQGFAHGYFVPGIGPDPGQPGYPTLPSGRR